MAHTARTCPSFPLSSQRRSRFTDGANWKLCTTASTNPRSRASAASSSPSSSVIVNGFSVSTCLPASSALRITRWCANGAVPQVTASIRSRSDSCSTPSASSWWGTFTRAAASRARSARRSARQSTS